MSRDIETENGGLATNKGGTKGGTGKLENKLFQRQEQVLPP